MVTSVVQPESPLSGGQLSAIHLARLISAVESTTVPLASVCSTAWDPKNGLPLSVSFDAGASLTALLQDSLLQVPAQRLVAIYMIYDIICTPRQPPADGKASSRSQDSEAKTLEARLVESPLSIILLELVERPDARPPEVLFLSNLLLSNQGSGGAVPVSGRFAESPAISLLGAVEAALRAGASLSKSNIGSLRRRWEEHHPEPVHQFMSVPPVSAVVLDPDMFPAPLPSEAVGVEGGGDNGKEEDPGSMSLLDALGGELGLIDFVPTFVRPPPPIVPINAESSELRWVDPEPLHEVVWDPQMCAARGRGGNLKDIIATALRSPLKEEQQQLVKAGLEADPKLVFQCGLTPQNLHDLVQNNSVIATEVLLRLLTSNQKEEYFEALVSMEMNQHSMAVVSRLTSGGKLPTEFIHTYVNNLIRGCGEIPDRFGQVRMVRFVCVFLQSLIKNDHVDVASLFIEVQAFCIEHSRIREAATLFRLLKMHGGSQQQQSL